ncbi:MAG: DUF1592 domain-containing protein [Hyalangium sp.]|uniref:DUF1592 domain-containing protein n=1 Tax=Hyalangium sp. TaxID=2028555 RepID=UPI00389B3481
MALACSFLGGCSGKAALDDVHTGPINTPQPSSGPPPPPFQPAPVTLRILLGWQYRNAIGSLLGVEAANAVQPPQDTAVNGFDAIGAAQLALSPSALVSYENSALHAAQAALSSTATRKTLIGCTPTSTTDESCLHDFLSQFGHRAWRRPLSEQELASWIHVGTAAATAYGDFYKGVEFAVAGLLQSPSFLYMVEVGQPDPEHPGRRKLTGLELATRLSFFLTGTTPSDELLAAAERGGLDTQEGVRAQALQLVSRPEAREALTRFFDEYLRLRELPTLSKDSTLFPFFTPELASGMREETQRFLADLVWDRNTDFREAFDSDSTFVNKDLATLYGLSGAPATGFARLKLPPESGRGGLLGQASLLTLLSHQTTTSPTVRGRFVRERLLCQPIPAPPPDVIPNLPEPQSGDQPQTMRQRLAEHQKNPACSGCHTRMDPIGFGLENFDPVGRFRDSDHGAPIDSVTQLDALGTFQNPRQLGQLLRRSDRTVPCLVRNVFRMATGHVEVEGETEPLSELAATFSRSGYHLRDLLVEITASDAFRYAADPEVQ